MSRKTTKERAELAEYTSLIRSLHTKSTQDALPHLLVPTSVSAPFFSGSRTPSPVRQTVHLATPNSLLSLPTLSGENTQINVVRSDLGGKDRGVVRNKSREGDVISGDRHFDMIQGSQEKRKGRSTWTRWPLLKEDVYIPEWTLQDEVQTLASKATREWINTYAAMEPNMSQEVIASQPSPSDGAVECSNPRENSPASPANPRSNMTRTATGDMPMDHVAIEDSSAGNSSLESTMLHPGVISGLTLEAENLLSRMLGALSAHWPLVDKSLQDRLQPMDGRAVLEIVGQAGIVDPERVITSLLLSWSNTITPFSRIILRVQRRLEGSQHTEEASASDDFHPAHLDPLTSSLPLAALTRSGALQTRRRKLAALEEELGEDPFDLIDDPYQSKPPLSMKGPCSSSASIYRKGHTKAETQRVHGTDGGYVASYQDITFTLPVQ
jgi:hypothetical protein